MTLNFPLPEYVYTSIYIDYDLNDYSPVRTDRSCSNLANKKKKKTPSLRDISTVITPFNAAMRACRNGALFTNLDSLIFNWMVHGACVCTIFRHPKGLKCVFFGSIAVYTMLRFESAFLFKQSTLRFGNGVVRASSSSPLRNFKM